jgi:hypothetical protein
MRRCQMFTVSARFVTVILPRINIQNARWEVTYIHLLYYHWIIHDNKYLAVRTCFLASFNGVMSAAVQRCTFRVENIYCHAKMTWAGVLIIQYTCMDLMCFCYFREVSCFKKKGQKYLFVWSYSVLSFGDMVVKIRAVQTLPLDLDVDEWLASQSSSFTRQRLRLSIRRVRSWVRSRALLAIVMKVESSLLPCRSLLVYSVIFRQLTNNW